MYFVHSRVQQIVCIRQVAIHRLYTEGSYVSFVPRPPHVHPPQGFPPPRGGTVTK